MGQGHTGILAQFLQRLDPHREHQCGPAFSQGTEGGLLNGILDDLLEPCLQMLRSAAFEDRVRESEGEATVLVDGGEERVVQIHDGTGAGEVGALTARSDLFEPAEVLTARGDQDDHTRLRAVGFVDGLGRELSRMNTVHHGAPP